MERRTILVFGVSSYGFPGVSPPGGAADSWGMWSLLTKMDGQDKEPSHHRERGGTRRKASFIWYLLTNPGQERF